MITVKNIRECEFLARTLVEQLATLRKTIEDTYENPIYNPDGLAIDIEAPLIGCKLTGEIRKQSKLLSEALIELRRKPSEQLSG